MNDLLPIELIEKRILLIRGQKVMLDRDLAELYGVETKALNQAVKRNIERFPEDFMFLLSEEEIQGLSQFVTTYATEERRSRSQIVTLSSRSQNATLKQGQNIKYPPRAFTEQGVAMLSSVLKSKRAIQVNILIMRVFTRLKNMLSTHKELARKIEELESRVGRHDSHIVNIIEAIKKLMEPKVEEPVIEKAKKIGFVK